MSIPVNQENANNARAPKSPNKRDHGAAAVMEPKSSEASAPSQSEHDHANEYTYSECKNLLREHGVTTIPQYTELLDKDSRLPRQPQQAYAGKGWQGGHQGWDHLFGIAPHDFKHACAAVKKLGLSKSSYPEGRKADPRLPEHPKQHYADQWVSYPHFFGTETKVEVLDQATPAIESEAKAPATTTKKRSRKSKAKAVT